STRLSLCLPFFFLSCSPAHRDLPSFPTRRSSDLPQVASAFGLQIGAQPLGIHGIGALVDVDEIRPRAGLRDHLRSGDEGERHRQDRKSTRLNSSHVSISYAVFCLKKKKQENSRQT